MTQQADVMEAPSQLYELVEAIRRFQAKTTKLPAERVLAEMLNVKRHQLRRALQILRDAGEVEQARPRSKSRSARPKREDLVNITNPVEVAELRRMIEPTFAKLAALRATPNEISAMQRALKEATGDSPRKPGTDIYRLIAQATGNTLAAELYNLLRRIEEDARLSAGVDGRSPRTGDVEQQKAIVDAIAARAPDKAEAVMTETLARLYRQSLFGSD